MRKASLLSKALLVAAVSIAVCSPAWADEYVDGYYRADGTYVQPYWRSDPDGNPYNNYSFPGNLNPYRGTIAPGNPDTYLDNYYDRGGLGGFDFPNFDDGDDD